MKHLTWVVAAMSALAACGGGSDAQNADYGGLSAFLTAEVGEVTRAEVEGIYPDPTCNRDESVVVLSANFDSEDLSATESEAANLEIVTQVAVDFFLCGRDYATDVITVAFSDEGVAELIELLDQLETYST